jgi:nucleoside-diphosphate-sugar epimerase
LSRVLVTGASGFIGKEALPLLTRAGFEVHGVARGLGGQGPTGMRWHQCDLLAAGSAENLLREVAPTHLLHLAWETTPGSYSTSPQNLRWLEASLALARAFCEAGGRRIVVAGTCAEYDWHHGCLKEGSTPLVPATLYGAAKGALLSVLSRYCRIAGVSAAWGRIFHLYGPGESQERLVASLTRALLRGEPARCTAGEQQRDFLYVADVASAFVTLLGSAVEGPVNIGSGKAVAVRTVATLLADVVGRPDLLRFGELPTRPEEPPLLAADVSRLNREVGWLPSYDLVSGLRATVAWWRETFAREPA